MRADVVLIRLIFTAILVVAGYKLAPVRDDPWLSAAAGALIAVCIIVFELRIRRATLKTLIGAAVGSILGIIGAYLGRLYDQSKGRPLFLIRDIVGGQDRSVAVKEPASAPVTRPPQVSA